MTRQYIKVFVILFVVSVLLILIFKWTGIKEFVIGLKGTPETPSLIRALPFDVLKMKRKERLPELREKLTPTQVLVEDVVANPKGAPRGKYLRVSVVVEAKDEDTAKRLSEEEGKIATLVLDTIQEFSYEDLTSRGGVAKFKKKLETKIRVLYGRDIRDVSVVEFRFKEAKR